LKEGKKYECSQKKFSNNPDLRSPDNNLSISSSINLADAINFFWLIMSILGSIMRAKFLFNYDEFKRLKEGKKYECSQKKFSNNPDLRFSVLNSS